jgi:hypothetical protein
MTTVAEYQALLLRLIDPSNRADPYAVYRQFRERGPLQTPGSNLTDVRGVPVSPRDVASARTAIRGRRICITSSTTSGRWPSTATSAWSGRPRSIPLSRWSFWPTDHGAALGSSGRRRST